MDAAKENYLSIQEVAKRFGVNPTTIYRLAQKGKIPGFKIGSQWRFSKAHLDSWADDQATISWFLDTPNGRLAPKDNDAKS